MDAMSLNPISICKTETYAGNIAAAPFRIRIVTCGRGDCKLFPQRPAYDDYTYSYDVGRPDPVAV